MNLTSKTLSWEHQYCCSPSDLNVETPYPWDTVDNVLLQTCWCSRPWLPAGAWWLHVAGVSGWWRRWCAVVSPDWNPIKQLFDVMHGCIHRCCITPPTARELISRRRAHPSSGSGACPDVSMDVYRHIVVISTPEHHYFSWGNSQKSD